MLAAEKLLQKIVVSYVVLAVPSLVNGIFHPATRHGNKAYNIDKECFLTYIS